MKEIKSTFWFWFLGIYCALFLIDGLWLSKYSMSMMFLDIEWKWNWGLAVFLAQLFYVLMSFRTVGPTELGARLFFGKPINEISAGLAFVPFLVCQLVKNTRNVIEDELPARPELIYRSERGKEEVVPENLLKAGYKPPIRIQFGGPGITIDVLENENEVVKRLYGKLNSLIVNKEIKDDPLNVRMTAETPLVIRWRIKNFCEFLKIFGSKEEAKDQIQDIAVAMLNREFSKITPAIAQAHLGTFSELVKEEIAERIGSNSIEIKTVLLRPFIYSHDLNVDLLKRAQAQAKKQATITDAEAQKQKDVLEGEGQGEKEKAIIDGRTKGFAYMVKELGVSPLVVLNAETARNITNNPGQKTIVAGSGGFADLLSVAAALGDTLKKEVK